MAPIVSIGVLTLHEAAMASGVGLRRQLSALFRRLPDKHGYDGYGWSEHIEGACGECMLAKHLGVYWDGSVDTFRSASDVLGYEVRTRSKHQYDLLIRENDKDDARYALLTGRCPNYLIHGWILGGDAKRSEWLKDYGGRPPAFFVPKAYLHALEPPPIVPGPMPTVQLDLPLGLASSVLTGQQF